MCTVYEAPGPRSAGPQVRRPGRDRAAGRTRAAIDRPDEPGVGRQHVVHLHVPRRPSTTVRDRQREPDRVTRRHRRVVRDLGDIDRTTTHLDRRRRGVRAVVRRRHRRACCPPASSPGSPLVVGELMCTVYEPPGPESAGPQVSVPVVIEQPAAPDPPSTVQESPASVGNTSFTFTFRAVPVPPLVTVSVNPIGVTRRSRTRCPPPWRYRSHHPAPRPTPTHYPSRRSSSTRTPCCPPASSPASPMSSAN